MSDTKVDPTTLRPPFTREYVTECFKRNQPRAYAKRRRGITGRLCAGTQWIGADGRTYWETLQLDLNGKTLACPYMPNPKPWLPVHPPVDPAPEAPPAPNPFAQSSTTTNTTEDHQLTERIHEPTERIQQDTAPTPEIPTVPHARNTTTDEKVDPTTLRPPFTPEYVKDLLEKNPRAQRTKHRWNMKLLCNGQMWIDGKGCHHSSREWYLPNPKPWLPVHPPDGVDPAPEAPPAPNPFNRPKTTEEVTQSIQQDYKDLKQKAETNTLSDQDQQKALQDMETMKALDKVNGTNYSGLADINNNNNDTKEEEAEQVLSAYAKQKAKFDAKNMGVDRDAKWAEMDKEHKEQLEANNGSDFLPYDEAGFKTFDENDEDFLLKTFIRRVDPGGRFRSHEWCRRSLRFLVTTGTEPSNFDVAKYRHSYNAVPRMIKELTTICQELRAAKKLAAALTADICIKPAVWLHREVAELGLTADCAHMTCVGEYPLFLSCAKEEKDLWHYVKTIRNGLVLHLGRLHQVYLRYESLTPVTRTEDIIVSNSSGHAFALDHNISTKD